MPTQADTGKHDRRAFWLANAARLDELLGAGLSRAEIARRLGTTKGAVMGRLNRAGKCAERDETHGPAFWREHDAIAEQMHADGMSFAAIGARIGRAKDTVRIRLIRLRKRREAAAALAARVPPMIFPPAGYCQWPDGNPGEAGFHWCGARTRIGQSFCPVHHRIAFRPARKLAEAA